MPDRQGTPIEADPPGPDQRPSSVAGAEAGVDTAAADRRTVRKALRAGVATTVVLSVVTLIANSVFGGDGLTAGVWMLSSVVLGSLVTAGWLILSIILDLIAGQVPGRGRMIWAGITFAIAFVSPILPAAMLQVIADR